MPGLCVFQATDKRKALEETMAFTTQALASVAYQVGNLAGHTLRMLDLQAAALRQVEARVSTLGQVKAGGKLLASAPNSSAPPGHLLQQKFFPAFLYIQTPTSVPESWHLPSFLSFHVSQGWALLSPSDQELPDGRTLSEFLPTR